MEKYVRGQMLGKGSYGAAYVATAKADGRKFVVKEISLQGLSQKEVKTATQEAEMLLSLQHPNIVSCREAFEQHNFLHIILEYCSEGDLSAVIGKQQGQPFPEDVILDWFSQLCLGLAHIHSHKIMHRDVKPQNILRSSKGSLKLADFGISRILDTTTAFASTCLGTPYYLSPEICANKPYNQKTDIWSLGCVLYEMAALKKPFLASTQTLLNKKIRAGQYAPLPSSYSKDIKALVASMLSIGPARRPDIKQILGMRLIRDRAKKFETAADKPRDEKISQPPGKISQPPSIPDKEPNQAQVPGSPGPQAQRDRQAERVSSAELLRQRAKAARQGQAEIARLRLLEEHRALEEEHRRAENARKATSADKRRAEEKAAAAAAAAVAQARNAEEQKARQAILALEAAKKDKQKRDLREQSRIAISRQKAVWAARKQPAGGLEPFIFAPPPRPAPAQMQPLPGPVSPQLQPPPKPSASHGRRWSDSAAPVPRPSPPHKRELPAILGSGHDGSGGWELSPREVQARVRFEQDMHDGREAADDHARLQFVNEDKVSAAGKKRQPPPPVVVMAAQRPVPAAEKKQDARSLAGVFGHGFSATGVFALADGREVDIGVDWSEALDVRTRAIRRALNRRLGPPIFERAYERLVGVTSDTTAVERLASVLDATQMVFVPLMVQLRIAEQLLKAV